MRGRRSDLSGKDFGRLHVVEYSHNDDRGNSIWLCECTCGGIKLVRGKDLISKSVQSCGCLQQESRKSFEDLTGKTFNMLTVLGFSHINNNGHTYWICKCECENIVVCNGNRIKRGDTKSCGCYRKIAYNKALARKSTSKIITKYGTFTVRSDIVQVYIRMVRRCYDPTNDSYNHYHKRGILVDKEWYDYEKVGKRYMDLSGVIKFIEDMYPSYLKHVELHGNKNTTLDRIDGSKNYSSANCRWATYRVQNNNISTNRHIYDGYEILTFAECVRKYISDDLLSGSYRHAPGNLINSKLDRGWTVNQLLAFLRYVHDTGIFLRKSELQSNTFIWRIDQRCVYEKFPNEQRLPGYSDT